MHWIDPDCLLETQGKVERFILNSHGEIDGFVLNGGKNGAKLVHVPPHLGSEIEHAVQPGEALSVRGVRPRGTDMIAAVALITAGDLSIVDNGPDHKRHEDHKGSRKAAIKATIVKGDVAEGKVRLSLHAPKGDLRGALLEDGTILRIGAKEAEHFRKLLQPGAWIAVRGDGIETAHGRVVESKETGPDLAHLKPANPPKHRNDHN